MKFKFDGSLAISKSWINRALIIQSYFDELQITGESSSDDVDHLKKALLDFKNGHLNFYVGLGGTTFRFLALRISRKPGTYKIKAEKKLFTRPQNELIRILSQLGVRSEFDADQTEFTIYSEGWKSSADTLSINVNSQDSSQFLSSILLNSFELPFDLYIHAEGKVISLDYLKYTLNMLNSCGAKIDETNYERFRVHKFSKVNLIKKLNGEVDVSSFFSLACAAVLAGDVHLRNWNSESRQPDMAFLDIFNQLGILFQTKGSDFRIHEQSLSRTASINLENCPDLFPSLAVVCAFAPGVTTLFGAKQLIHKESNRILKTHELLSLCGIPSDLQNDGLKIHGDPNYQFRTKNILFFDPSHDHRMAFAAALLILKGYPIKIQHPEVITKSYPQFYEHIGLDISIQNGVEI